MTVPRDSSDGYTPLPGRGVSPSRGGDATSTRAPPSRTTAARVPTRPRSTALDRARSFARSTRAVRSRGLVDRDSRVALETPGSRIPARHGRLPRAPLERLRRALRDDERHEERHARVHAERRRGEREEAVPDDVHRAPRPRRARRSRERHVLLLRLPARRPRGQAPVHPREARARHARGRPHRRRRGAHRARGAPEAPAPNDRSRHRRGPRPGRGARVPVRPRGVVVVPAALEAVVTRLLGPPPRVRLPRFPAAPPRDRARDARDAPRPAHGDQRRQVAPRGRVRPRRRRRRRRPKIVVVAAAPRLVESIRRRVGLPRPRRRARRVGPERTAHRARVPRVVPPDRTRRRRRARPAKKKPPSLGGGGRRRRRRRVDRREALLRPRPPRRGATRGEDANEDAQGLPVLGRRFRGDRHRVPAVPPTGPRADVVRRRARRPERPGAGREARARTRARVRRRRVQSVQRLLRRRCGRNGRRGGRRDDAGRGDEKDFSRRVLRGGGRDRSGPGHRRADALPRAHEGYHVHGRTSRRGGDASRRDVPAGDARGHRADAPRRRGNGRRLPRRRRRGRVVAPVRRHLGRSHGRGGEARSPRRGHAIGGGGGVFPRRRDPRHRRMRRRAHRANLGLARRERRRGRASRRGRGRRRVADVE